MNKTNSIIEINGNRYDAVTGKLIGPDRKIKRSSNVSRKKMVDSFTVTTSPKKSVTKKTTHILPKSAAKDRPKNTAQGLHTPPQKPRTLIRKGLKKPIGDQVKENFKPSQRADVINSDKLFRAHSVSTNPQVKRFGHFKTSFGAQDNVAVRKSKSRASVAVIPRTTAPSPRPASLVTSVSHRKLENMLDQALIKADAHKHMTNHQSPKRGLAGRASRMPRWLSFSMVSFVLAATAAFLIYQNLPAVAVHVAASKAHVNASMPGYTPAGFSYKGPLSYTRGAVTMHFEDKLNPSQRFTLTQATTKLNSSALETTKLPQQANLQSSQVNGTTVYIYGENNDAMWVNQSVLYSLKNKAELSSDQVLRIVQGL